MEIRNFDDFAAGLLECGFSMGGGNAKGIFALIPFGWEEQDTVDSPVRWHTGDPGTDPWEWRMRVLEERDDIAYSKLFFRTSGFISREWYPYFYAVRRGGMSLREAYSAGTVSGTAKKIYDIIADNGELAFHEIKQLGGFGKESNSRFEGALTELQMRMFVTMSGRLRKLNKLGEPYGWSSTAFTTVERFWELRGFTIPEIDAGVAEAKIREKILQLNPAADGRKILKFIKG